MRLYGFSALVVTLFFPTASSATTNIVSVGGKVYEIQFKVPEIRACPADAPSFSAFTFLHNFAYDGGYSIAKSACLATCSGQSTDADQCKVICSAEDQVVRFTKFAQEQVFTFMRGYPPSYQAAPCKRAREFCFSKCISRDAFSEEQCRIDCEQYETYTKSTR
jgi:hypothetical protein